MLKITPSILDVLILAPQALQQRQANRAGQQQGGHRSSKVIQTPNIDIEIDNFINPTPMVIGKVVRTLIILYQNGLLHS